jgi:hypothetical protein
MKVILLIQLILSLALVTMLSAATVTCALTKSPERTILHLVFLCISVYLSVHASKEYIKEDIIP